MTRLIEPLRVEDEPKRAVAAALWCGFRERCPRCGEGRMFRAYLKVDETCPACGEELLYQRADDAPPYVTMLIVGHVLIALYVAAEDYGPALPAPAQVAIFCFLGMAMSLLLLPRVKGALVALQWALRMHGFHGPNGRTSGPFAHDNTDPRSPTGRQAEAADHRRRAAGA